MAQPEQSESEPSGRPLAGGSGNKMDLAAGLTRAHALGASPHACGVPLGLLASPTHNTAFEAPHDCNFTTRGKSGPFTRTCTSISGFAGPRPIYWTMKGETESRSRVARAGLRQIV
jgi:hypothetical protein